MATLAEILALLPDNTSGEISAADMRFSFTGVWDETEKAVKTINGVAPNSAGEIATPTGTVKTVNGVAPNGAGEVATPQGTVKTVNGLAPDIAGDVTTPTGITLLPEGTQPPLGSPPGIYGFIPNTPPPLPFASISYDTLGTTVACPVPGSIAVGDAVIFIPGFAPTTATVNDITCTDPGWTEIIDYSPNQSRKSAVYVYRVSDATALANLGATVTANNTDSSRRAGVTYAIPGSRVATAWPTYSSGSNRSAATLNSNTTTGCQIQGFSTVTVPFHKVIAYIMEDAASAPSASTGFTEAGWATGSSGGAVPFTLTLLVKDLSAGPIPAATITHPTADTSTHGGGQFIVPVA